MYSTIFFKFSSFSQSIIPLCQRVFWLKPEMTDQFLIVGHAGQQLELADQISFGEWTNMNLCIFALAILLEIDQVRRTRFDEIHHLLLNRLKSFEIRGVCFLSDFELRRTKTYKNSNANLLSSSTAEASVCIFGKSFGDEDGTRTSAPRELWDEYRTRTSYFRSSYGGLIKIQIKSSDVFLQSNTQR